MPVIPVKDTLKIFQGATFQHRWKYVDSDDNVINITGYSARLQVRERWEASAKLIDATDGNGKLVIVGASGTIDLLLTATETALLDFDSAVFDLELLHSDAVTVDKMAYGPVQLVREITR